jgi:hypothetical protein
MNLTSQDDEEIVTLSVGLYPNAISKGIEKVLELKQALELSLTEQKVLCHVQAWADRITVSCHSDYARIVAQVCSDNPLCASISEDYTLKASEFLDEEIYSQILSGKTPQHVKEEKYSRKVIDSFIEVVEPSDITLRQLLELRKVLLKNDIKLAQYFIDKKDGVGQIHRALSVLMTPFSSTISTTISDTIEEQTDIRHQLVLVLTDLFAMMGNVDFFINHRDICKSLVLGLSSPIVATPTRGEILLLLSFICNGSPKGSWLILEAMNHFKLINREQVRFEYLAFSMHLAITKLSTKENTDYVIACMTLINSLLASLQNDLPTRASIQKELVAAQIPQIVTRLSEAVKDSEESVLQYQIKTFQTVMADESYQKNVEDPEEVVKAIVTKLRGLPSVSNFSHILTMLNTLAEETVVHEKALEDWRIVDTMISRAITNEGKHGELSVNEIRLHDRISVLQKQISKLERREHQTVKYIREMATSSKKLYIEKDVDIIYDIIQQVSDMIDRVGSSKVTMSENVPLPPIMMMAPPPPPPPPMMPPPPPPPMMPKLNIGNGVPPPIVTTAHTVQLKNKASKPMRNIFWDTIHARYVEKSLFMKKGIAEQANEMDLEITKIEEMFAKQDSANNTPSDDGVDIKSPRTPRTPRTPRNQPQFINLIDTKRAQHVAIVVRQFKMPIHELKQAILRMDDTLLGESDIAFLRQVAPTKEELAKVRAYNGDVNMLAEADRFFMDIQEICDNLVPRLEAWQYKNSFDDTMGSLRADTETIISAIEEIMTSNAFHSVLALILAIGNFLNGEKKQALGIRISSLAKLAQVKTTQSDGDSNNLLEYIVSYAVKKNLSNFSEQLSSLQSASRVDPAKMTQNMNDLTGGMNKLVRQKIAPLNNSDPFEHIMAEFLSEAEYALEKFKQRYEVMNNAIKSLADGFGEDTNQLLAGGYASFFQDIARFTDDFNKIRDAQIEREARRERIEAKNKKIIDENKQNGDEFMEPTGEREVSTENNVIEQTRLKLELSLAKDR